MAGERGMCRQGVGGLLARRLLGLFCVFLLLFYPISVIAGSYTDSAHGDSGYGVLRSDMPARYARGNCGHCHKQHDGAAEGMLFEANFTGNTTNPYAADHNVCFQCHRAANPVQADGGITNNDYSATFSAASATTNGIMAAFNQASYHNLYDLQQYITGNSGSKSFPDFPDWSNPCSGCHNAHLAKANKRATSDPTETAISKPSSHESLWGDDSPAERMSVYWPGYQPPNYGNGNLEPDGDSSDAVIQAAKTPNYNAFCTDCHNDSNSIYSTELGRNLRTFDWSSEAHGEGRAVDWRVLLEMQSPYTDSGLGDYVLSCMDCHEPHGSRNVYLIRPSVNAGAVSLLPGSESWNELCARCHVDISDLHEHHHRVSGNYECTDCHVLRPMHGSAGEMQSCINCHFHGSASGELQTF